MIRSIKNRIFRIYIRFKTFNESPDKIIKDFFIKNNEKFIIQVGGNDGVTADPLRKYLKFPGNYRAIIIEPISFYFNKLNNLYLDRNDIKLLKKFVSNEKRIDKIYYIPPKIANQMNGHGPKNDWAHGQGSFSKEFIINEIKKNSFRGNNYIRNMNKFIESIIYEEVENISIKEIKTKKDDLKLLVIDAQGYEFNILKSINFTEQNFDIIYYEDEDLTLPESKKIRKFLRSNNYFFKSFHSNNVVFTKQKNLLSKIFGLFEKIIDT